MRCPSCRAENPPTAISCIECGERLPVATAEKPAPRYPIAQAQVDDEEILDVLPATRRSPKDRDDDDEFDETGDGGISTLIPYRNPKALAAYYVGFFSLIPVVGLLTAPFAVVLGILGVRTARRKPEAKGLVHACIGILFGSLSLLCNPLCLFLFFYGPIQELRR
jgi:hypothetical protein